MATNRSPFAASSVLAKSGIVPGAAVTKEPIKQGTEYQSWNLGARNGADFQFDPARIESSDFDGATIVFNANFLRFEDRNGENILIVAMVDTTQQFPKLDANGNTITDEDGKIVMQHPFVNYHESGISVPRDWARNTFRLHMDTFRHSPSGTEFTKDEWLMLKMQPQIRGGTKPTVEQAKAIRKNSAESLAASLRKTNKQISEIEGDYQPLPE